MNSPCRSMMPSANHHASGRWDGLESAIRAFEAAWQGGPPSIDDYLPGNGPQRGQALIERSVAASVGSAAIPPDALLDRIRAFFRFDR